MCSVASQPVQASSAARGRSRRSRGWCGCPCARCARHADGIAERLAAVARLPDQGRSRDHGSRARRLAPAAREPAPPGRPRAAPANSWTDDYLGLLDAELALRNAAACQAGAGRGRSRRGPRRRRARGCRRVVVLPATAGKGQETCAPYCSLSSIAHGSRSRWLLSWRRLSWQTGSR